MNRIWFVGHALRYLGHKRHFHKFYFSVVLWALSRVLWRTTTRATSLWCKIIKGIVHSVVQHPLYKGLLWQLYSRMQHLEDHCVSWGTEGGPLITRPLCFVICFAFFFLCQKAINRDSCLYGVVELIDMVLCPWKANCIKILLAIYL